MVLSYEESNLLSALGGMSTAARRFELSSRVNLPPSEVNRFLEKLADKGLLTVTANFVDLTPDGRNASRLLDKARAPLATAPSVLVTNERAASQIEAGDSQENLERAIDQALEKLAHEG